jgi:HlyD family type I secretion membrane fusion protein
MLSNPSPDRLHPVSSDEFLPPISRWTTLGGGFLIGTVGVAIALATFISANVIIKAPGAVRPTGETRVVQSANAGTVERIFAKENQVVQAGEVIAQLDDTQLQTQKNQLTDSIQNQQQELKQLTDQIRELDMQAAAEAQLTSRTVAADQADLRRNQRDHRNQQVTTQAEVQAATATLKLAQQELTRFQKLADTGAISQLQIEEKIEAFKIAQAKLDSARVALNPSADQVTIVEERIAQSQAKGDSTLATLNKEEKAIIQQKIKLQTQINHDRQALRQLKTQLHKSIIRAPEAGTILQLNLRNLQQLVKPGDAIAQLVPSHAPLTIKVRVSAAEISQVKVCQQARVTACAAGKVQLRIAAYPYPDYGTLKGAVRAIAPDATMPQNHGSGEVATSPYYEVTIQPERSALVKGNRSYPLQAGMDVKADIIAREETLLTGVLRKVRLLTDW